MKKISIILTTILFCFICLTTVVFATNKMDLKINQTSLNLGDELTATINFDIEEGSSLYSYTARLNYNKDVFEIIEKENFEDQENWADIKYSSYDNKFELTSKDEENSSKVINIKLKVKEDANLGETTITLDGGSIFNSENTINLEDASQKINIIGNEENQAIQFETKNQFPWLILILAILCLAIILIIVKVLPNLRLTKMEKNVITVIAIILIILLLIVIFEKTFNKSSNVNTYFDTNFEEDSKKTARYILEIKNPSNELPNTEEENNNNNNEDITTEDKIENSTSYQTNSGKVNSSNNGNSNNSNNNNNSNSNNSNNNSNSNNGNNDNNNNNNNDDNNHNNGEVTPAEKYGFEKKNMILSEKVSSNDELILSFENATESKYAVKSVIIDGVEYQVHNENGKYTVKLPKGTKGIKNSVNVEKVILENGYEQEINEKFEYIYLKDKPTIEKINVEQDNTNLKVNLDIKDNDLAIKDITIYLIDENGNIISEQKSSESGNLFEVSKSGTYKIKVKTTYDLGDGIESSIEQATKDTYTVQVKTKASITKAEVQNYYVKKGENVEIKYTFESSNNESKPKGVNINDTFYPATENDDGTYTVFIPAESSGYGIKKHIAEIAMFGEETVILENTEDAIYYLLKDEPSIEYTFNEFVKNQSLEFTLKNSENAIIKDAKVILTNNANEEVLSMPLNEETIIELNKIPNGIYTLSLSGTYDLDDDENNNQNTHNLSEIFESREIQITSTYTANLAINNVEVKEESAIITFTSTNSSDADVEYVIVDGEKYKVTKQENTNTYTVEVPHKNEENAIKKITAVIIRNDIDINLEQEQTYEVFKAKPTVKDITAEQDADNLNVNFTFEDLSSIAKNAKVVVKKDNNVIQSKEIETKDTNIVFENITQAGTYTIEFLADYDRADGKDHNQEKINEKDVTFTVSLTAKVELLKDSLNEYYDKDSEVILTYHITLNTEEPITSIRIDETNYNQENFKISNGNYVIKVIAPNKAGEKTYNLEEIKCGDKSATVNNTEAKIFVLKAKPNITNFVLDRKAKTITFNLNNPDSARIDGKVMLKSLDGREVYQYPEDLKNGKNIIDLTKLNGMNETTTYEVVLDGIYDLDDNENGKNEYSLLDFIKEEIQLKIVTDIAFDSFSTRYPEKGKDIEITFNVTSNTKIPVSEIYVNYKPYKATLVSDNKYKITYTAKKTSGIENLTVNKVKHGIEEVETKEPKSEMIEVLRSRPKVPFNYEIDDNYDEKTITFKFTLEDSENVLENGKAYVSLANGKFKDTNGQTNVPVQVGYNEITFVNVEEGRGLPLCVSANYDLDTNILNDILQRNDNKYENSTLLKVIVFLLPPSVLDVNNITALDPTTGESSIYLNKNSEFKLSFTSETYIGSLDGQKISYYPVSAIINGKKYELDKNGNTYTTKETLSGYIKSGKQTITIDSVTLNNHEVVEEDIIGTLEVLKDKLSVENLAINTESKKAILTYNLIDLDNSFVSGLVKFTNVENNTETTLEVNNKENSYELNLEPYKIYSVTLEMTYDLDEDKQNTEHQDKITYGPIETELVPEYNLKIENAKITSMNNEEHKVTIEFTSTNNSHSKIKTVKVGDNDYVVTPLEPAEDNKYAFEYPYGEELENKRTEIKISDVLLGNNVRITPSQNDSVIIFKNKPEVTSIDGKVENVTNINAEFEIKDDDETLTKLYAVLKDQNGNELQSKDLNVNDRKVTFEGVSAGKYIVEILADYNLVDGKENIKVSLKESSLIEVEAVATIKTNSISNKFPAKGDTITLDYNITSNTGLPVSSVMINGTEYPVTKYSEGNYKISYTVPTNFGLHSIDLTMVNFENKLSAKIEGGYKEQVDILKSTPTITNFTTTEKLENGAVVFTFKINDPDGAFVSGKANVDEDIREITKDMVDDTITLIFNVKLDELKTFKVEINYNLDSDSTDIYNSDVLLFEQQFSLVYDYNLTLKNVQTYKEGENTPTKYFAQNEPIQLRFNCENKIGIKATQIKIKDVNDKTTDGKWYDVTAVENADGTVNYYYATLDSKDKPGLEELEIVEIMLSTGKTISKDDFAEKPSNITVDILKNIPEITDFTTTNNQANFTISFNVIDKDDALLDSYIKVVNKENNEDIALNEKITKGKNTHNVTLKEDISYTLTIERNYNLDSQKDDDQNIKYEVIITKDLEIAGSNFKIKNLSLPKRIPNGSTAVMTFENELMSYQDVEEIKIDNEYHDVTKDSKTGEYSLTLTPEKVGINTIYLENVKMGGKTFDIDRYASYIHEKAQPEAYEVTDIEEDKTENVAKISYKLKDPDKTIKTLTAVMKNSAGAVAVTKVLDDPTTTSFDMPLLKTFRYTIELKAEYDVGDGKTFDTKTLFEQTKETEGFVSLLEENINTKYVTKGEEVTLIYKIFTNVDQEVKKIFIDDISYNVEKEKDEKGNIVEDTYRVTMKAPEDSGIFEQHVTRMQIGTNTYPVDDKNPVKIRVLKDKPTLTHFIIDENANTLSFKVNDKDKSLTKAPIFTITNNKTSNKNTQNLKNTESEYTFNLKTLGINQINEEYHIIVNASYDLKPQEDKANKAQEKSTEPEIETEGTEDIFERDIKLSGKIDYNFKFTNFKNMSEFTVSMPQRVEFDCYNSSDYAVAKVIIDDEEYPVYKVESRDSDCRYGFMYKAKSYDQVSFQYKKIILENGASYDVSDDPNSYTYLWMVYAGPTIEITELEENISNKKMTFKYKVNDTDKTLNGVEDPIFILKDSNGKEITRKDISVENNSVEFDIPNPPSSSYQVEIRAPRVLRAQDLYEKNVQLGTGEFESSVNTSILSAKFETLYPKKGETIIIDYTISSTKVILVDPEDHANLSKAVNISSLVVNGSEYTTEYLGNYVYRIYYTAKNTAGIENINVSQINFSNNTTEIFDRTDKVEVLKALPKITNYKTENNILDGTVTFTFNLEDEDSILTSGSIRAVVGDQSESIKLGENKKTFKATTDILSKFEIRGTFDLDEDTLNSETGEDQNRYEDDVIFTKPFMLTGSYDIEFNNITTYNSKLEKTKYFEKNEDIKVEFEFSAKEGLELDQINVNGENYIPEQDAENKTKYSITIKGTDKSGSVNASITSVTLNSGNNVNLVDKNISYEVLKDIIKVESFNYSVTEEDADDIKLEINVSDKDNSNKQIRLEIKDEYGKPINVINPNLNLGDNTVIFEKTNAAKYFVSIYADYERDENDTDTENSYKNIRVYYEVVTIDTRYIEMKDIVDVQLYRFSDTTGSVERVYSLTERNLKVLDNCIVKVTMRDITPFFAEINSYDIKDGKLTLMLDYDDAMIYTGKDLKKLEVTLDILTDQSYEYKGSFKTLAEKIKENPKAEITLDKDYDLADYPGNLDDSEAIIDKFEGTLNGNGHMISNLHKPLFNTITNGKIQNIKFNNITFTKKNQRAVVVKTGSGAQITNVHIDGVTFVDGSCGDNNSAFAYELKDNSIVQNSSAININFTPGYLGQANAGGVSNMYNSTIKNCYVEGRITSGWHFNGGLVGRAHNNSQIINNIVNMYVTPYYGLTSSESSGNGGIVGSSNATDVVLKNNLSLIDSTDKISTIYNPKNGNTISDSSENNYQLEDTVATKQTHKGIKSVKKSDINDKLFETMNFDKSIWNITEETSFENLPTLKGNTVAFLDKGAKPNYSETYIPDYSRISNSTDYDKEREIIYHNMYKLMPFYDAKEILTDGNKISKTHKLNQKFIKYVLAYDDKGKLVSSLNTKNYNSLRKISIVFEDGDELEYSIDFDDYYGNVVSYIVSELNIGYNYNRFVIHEDLDIVKKLVDEASKYDFTRDLDPLTKDEDSRLYKEYFDNVTKHHITEFVETILTNSEYVPTFENEVLNNLIIQNLIDTGKLKELLFAYNYFKYWYSLDMDNVDVADSIMFHGSEMFSKGMTLSNISSDLVKGSNSATNVTGNFYRNNLSQYTKLSNLGEFLNYYVTSLTKFNSGNDWFKANWHGGIYIDIDINRPNVYYTIWDHVMRSSNVQNSFLPLFTVPENSMYVITSPTQTFYGSLRIYMQNPNDPAQLEKFRNNELAQFTRQVRNFYTFAYDFVGAEYLNPFVDVQYDMRTTLTDKGTKYNNPKTTTENYHKYFAEAINKWPASNGSGAYANGSEVYWNVIKLISGFNVSTHESLHNQDSKVFLKGYGRRGKDGNSEDYTAGNLQQYYNEGWVSPNIMEEELSAKSLGHPITQNYRLDRVNTNAKLQDFYDKYFRLNDMLDYIEAKAFLTLTNQEKANVAAQVSYPRLANKSKEEQDKGDSHVQYDPLTLDKVNQMKLNDVADLWDNKIMLRPGLKETQIFSPGAATDSLYNIRWYQPHADDDRPDGANFKWLAWEMAGTGGYYDGYMAYYSQNYIDKNTDNKGQKTTDLIALKYITGKDSFRQYKLDRYDYAKKHYGDKDTYINAEEIFKEYVEALKKDAKDPKRPLSYSTAVKRKYFIGIKEETNDLEIDPFSKKTTTSSINNENLTTKVETKTNNTKTKVVDKNTNSIEKNTTVTTNSTNSTNTTNTSNTTNTVAENSISTSTNTLAKPNENKKENVVGNTIETTE